jgi:hypothetical protein
VIETANRRRPVPEDHGHDTPCLIWQGALNRDGYGRRRVIDYQPDYAHRVAYAEVHGTIPDGVVLRHRCGVRACVNVDHLEPVSRAEHMARNAAPAGGGAS